MNREETTTKKTAAGVEPRDNGSVSDDIERARLASIVDSSEDAILSKTLDGTITSWNASAERLYGYTAEEIIGREVFVIVPPELHGQVNEILARLRRGERGFRGETVRVRKDGSRVDVAVTVSPIRNAAGEVVGGSTIARDISELKRTKAELARLLSEREQALEELSTPVVPVLEGVLVLPLIGSLDTTRAERATRAVLSEVKRQGARVAILDITGARIVDSHAVARLTSLVQALKLVGADAYVTGVGAHVAQTLVGLGLDMHGLKTFRTLAQAIAALVGNGTRR